MLTDEYDGEFDLKFEFHTEVAAKEKRSIAWVDRQMCFWPCFKVYQRGFQAD